VTGIASPAQRRAWADENLLAGFELLARHPPLGPAKPPRRFGSAIAFPTGRRAAFFNPVAILAPVAPADLAAAVGWMRDLGVRPSLRIRDDTEDDVLRATAAELGLRREAWSEPAMVLHPLREPPALPSGLTIETATAATMDRFYVVNAQAFDLPPALAGLVRDLTPPEVVDDPDIRLFGGYLDGEPVACSFAIRSSSVVGVYAVGTTQAARHRGIATAMTWAAVAAGQAWGCVAATLQASEMGEPVYRAMGFETAARYVTYEEPRPAAQPASDQPSGSLSMSRVEPNPTASESKAPPSTRSSSRSVEASATET
jgi:GNAT superfamily N-acetyltransferase